MFGSAACEVAIGLAFTFTVFGGVCSGLREFIARVMSERERLLVSAVRRLLGSSANDTTVDATTFVTLNDLTDIAARAGMISKNSLSALVMCHPLVRTLAKDAKAAPSYLPARSFALALLDVLLPDKSERTVQAVRDVVTKLGDEHVRNSLLALIDAGNNDLGKLQLAFERHFDDAMDRASGWYKRRTQVVIFVLGCVVTLAANLDSIHLADALWQNPTQRENVVLAASHTTSATTASPAAASVVEVLPIGWRSFPDKDSPYQWLVRIVGWLLSAVAITMGGPFWFDVLSRIANLRAAGPPPERTT